MTLLNRSTILVVQSEVRHLSMTANVTRFGAGLHSAFCEANGRTMIECHLNSVAASIVLIQDLVLDLIAFV